MNDVQSNLSLLLIAINSIAAAVAAVLRFPQSSGGSGQLGEN